MAPLDDREDEAEGLSSSFSQKLISRRLLLKTMGLTAVGSVAATLPLPAFGAPVAPAAPASSVDEALKIANAHPMFQEAQLELQGRGFRVDAFKEAVRQSSSNGVFVGLVLRHVQSASQRTGVDVLLTVDTSAKQLTALQMVVGTCMVDMFLVTSTSFDVRHASYEELRSGRVHFQQPPALIRPRSEQQWSQPQPDSLLRLDELVESGWLKESPTDCYWHYRGCEKTEWIADSDTLIYRCSQVAENQSCQPDQQITIDLQYSSNIR